MIIQIAQDQLKDTLNLLKGVGKSGREYMIFWLGIRGQTAISIKEVFVPFQITSRISIQIPEKGMVELFEHLRKTRYFLAAQIHIHPIHAFHSDADDLLAVLRHEGAISLVLPWFGLKTTTSSFFKDAVCYVLSEKGSWELGDIRSHIELIQ